MKPRSASPGSIVRLALALTFALLAVDIAAARMMGGGMMDGVRPNENAAASDLNSTAGRAYAQTCAQCHALPDPRQHTADQWPSVVNRMQRRMAATGRSVPSASTLKAILGYLKAHAAHP